MTLSIITQLSGTPASGYGRNGSGVARERVWLMPQPSALLIAAAVGVKRDHNSTCVSEVEHRHT